MFSILDKIHENLNTAVMIIITQLASLEEDKTLEVEQ